MHRAGLALLAAALAALALVAPTATAAATGFDQDVGLAAGTRQSWPISGSSGDPIDISWDATAPVDVAVVANGTWDNATVPQFAALDQSAGQGHLTLAGAGPWAFFLDNSGSPPGGANGTSAVTAHVRVVPSPVLAPVPLPTSSAPQPSPESGGEAPTFVNTLEFNAPQWTPGGVVGFTPVALWMLLLPLLCLYHWTSPTAKAAVILGLAAAFTALWGLVPHPGSIVQVLLPMLAGVGLGYMAVAATQRVQDATRLAILPAALGAFLGTALAYGLRSLWSHPGIVVLGRDGFTDPVFTVPASALLGVVLFKLIPDIVHAFDDANADAARTATAGTPQADAFTVTCLRCHTEIKVDRSMKRYRVATDRFEFACPNCQYWMEWADPHAKGAAAA
jgi:hypothetical protein